MMKKQIEEFKLEIPEETQTKINELIGQLEEIKKLPSQTKD